MVTHSFHPNLRRLRLTCSSSMVIRPAESKQAGQLLLMVKALSMQSSQNLCSTQTFGWVRSGWSTVSWQRAQKMDSCRSEIVDELK